jgi:hypothetical protein
MSRLLAGLLIGFLLGSIFQAWLDQPLTPHWRWER